MDDDDDEGAADAGGDGPMTVPPLPAIEALPDDDGDGLGRFRRLEVIDGDGRPRIVLGDLGPGAGVGIALVDQAGRRRLVASLDEGGPVLVLDQGGNIRVEVGVHDAVADAVHVGPYAMLNDDDGRPAVGVTVQRDGSVTFLSPGAASRGP